MQTLGVILSPGRCGTRSIAAYLATIDRADLHVYHERLSVEHTEPRRFFRAYDPALMEQQAAQPEVAAWLAELDAAGPENVTIETGWTAYPLLPLLIERYGERVRVLHLTRHPVKVAASLALHGLYEERRHGELGREPWPLIDPASARVFHPELAEAWPELSLFERSLFRVTEINLFGLELRRRHPELAWSTLRVEDFDAGTVVRLRQFFGLPDGPPEPLPRSNETTRLARGARSVGEEWRRAAGHPWAVSAAEPFGYDLSPAGLARLAPAMRRYRRSGLVEGVAGLVYRVGPLRRLWRRLIVPRRGRGRPHA